MHNNKQETVRSLQEKSKRNAENQILSLSSSFKYTSQLQVSFAETHPKKLKSASIARGKIQPYTLIMQRCNAAVGPLHIMMMKQNIIKRSQVIRAINCSTWANNKFHA